MAVVVGVALVALAGCHSDNTPTAYGPDVQASFTEACTANLGEIDGTTTTLASSGYCDCTYNVFVNNVPFNSDDQKNRDNGATFANYSGKVFTDIENDLKDNPSDITNTSFIPQNVQDLLSGCTSSSNTGTTVAPVGPAAPGAGTTVPGTTPGSAPAR